MLLLSLWKKFLCHAYESRRRRRFVVSAAAPRLVCPETTKILRHEKCPVIINNRRTGPAAIHLQDKEHEVFIE